MKILIIGYGKTGKSLKKYFDKYQNEVFIYDENYVNDQRYYSYEKLIKEKPIFDLGIKSPGIRINNEKILLIMSLCRDVQSEIDYAYSHIDKAHIIGITGSNGKTTLATFLNHFLSLKNIVFLVGNIGKPFIEVVDEVAKGDYIILELSSFQINDSKLLKLDELFITSLSPNHLNYYLTLDHYYCDKKRALLFLKNINDYYTLNDSNVSLNIKAKDFVKEKDFSRYISNYLIGKYFIQYANIAMNYCYKLGYSECELLNLLSTLSLVKFRLNKVYEINNYIFINDSKSTTSSSSKYCYESFTGRKRILILGGIHKSDSFSQINIMDNDEVLIFGKDKEIIKLQIDGKIFLSLKEILLYIKSIKDKCYVLFSPGCDSHDLFKSYVDRGNCFNRLIKEVFNE